MQMAKANDADILALLDVAGVVEGREKGYLPARDGEGDDAELWLGRDNLQHCQLVIDKLVEASGRGGLMRAAFGLTVLLHPKNELVDPDADIIKKHPKILHALSVQRENEEILERYRFLLQLLQDRGVLHQSEVGTWVLRELKTGDGRHGGVGTTPELAIDNASATAKPCSAKTPEGGSFETAARAIENGDRRG